ncbi:MAG: 5-(carboxyamino)imidazole ribonucleotide mutase [Clostridiales bacterium]|nr:5-(carboxyamino)imidazole ribonucleotide mutase [Clostridiales bacterium]
MVAKVLVVMGSDSDYPVVKDCLKVLKDFGVYFDAEVCSAHRTPERAAKLAGSAIENGYSVIIAAAGKAAHLPGVLAAFTTLPVIGLPIKSSLQDGMDSLLSIVQMPPGVPVATVAVNGAVNAGLLAVQMLALKYSELETKLSNYKQTMKSKVEKKNENLQDIINNEI